MNKAIRNWIGLAGFVAIAASFSMAACGGSKSESDEDATGGTGATGGSSDDGGSSTAGGTTASGGATATAGTDSAACAVTDPIPSDVTCEAATVSCNPLMTDFTAATYDSAATKWGTTTTLTGGTFFYDGDGDDTIDVLAATVESEELRVTGIIAKSSYAGYGFWFGPACNDARHYSGISFDIRGTTGNTQLQVQLQTSRNYPVDTDNKKGECVGDWGKPCNSNTKTFGAELVLTDTLQTVKMPWTDFTGGAPIDGVEPSELVGFQWHFNCGADGECTPDVYLDNVTFY